MNFDRIENHIYAMTSRIEVTSSRMFRRPFNIWPWDLVEGPIEDQIATYQAHVIDHNGRRLQEVCEVTFHVKPHSETALNLCCIDPVPLLFDTHADNRGCELVSLDMSLQAQPDVVLSYGALIRSRRHADDYEFIFGFSQIMRDSNPID